MVVGQYVSAGQVIGTSGATGNTGNPPGAHLHFGVINDQTWVVDPFGWSGSDADPWQTAHSAAVSWYMWVPEVSITSISQGQQTITASLPDPTYNPHNADCLSPAICVEDTTNNSAGFRKGSGGPFNNVCQNDCGGWTSQTFTGAPAGLDGHLYYAYTNVSSASWAE